MTSDAIADRTLCLLQEFPDNIESSVNLCKQCIKRGLYDDAYNLLDNITKQCKLTSEVSYNALEHYSNKDKKRRIKTNDYIS